MQSDCVLTSSITKWGFKFLLLFIQMLILPLCFVQLHTHINSLTKQLTLWLVCRGTLSALICRLSVIRLVSPLIPPMLCFLIGDHSSAAFRFLLIISSHIKPWLGIPDSNFPAGLTLFFYWSLSTVSIYHCDTVISAMILDFACLFVGCFLEEGGNLFRLRLVKSMASNLQWKNTQVQETTSLLISVR